VLQVLMWPEAADVARTEDFRQHLHDPLVTRLQGILYQVGVISYPSPPLSPLKQQGQMVRNHGNLVLDVVSKPSEPQGLSRRDKPAGSHGLKPRWSVETLYPVAARSMRS